MHQTRLIVRHRVRHRLRTLLAALFAALGIVGCNLNAEQWEAIEPSAEVSISPSTFCVGEILTVSWDGGPQVATCGSAPNVDDCKGAALSVTPNRPSGLSFPFGFDAFNLSGSASGPADIFSAYGARYYVEWDGWAGRRGYREWWDSPAPARWHGVVRAQAEAEPLGEGEGSVAYLDTLVCDETTRTWRFGRTQDSAIVTTGGGGYSGPGGLSACAGITGQVCIPDTYRSAAYTFTVSVPGGPSVVLGPEGNPSGYPRCTDAFVGYHPEDVRIEPYPPGTHWAAGVGGQVYGGSCTPGFDGRGYYWIGQSFLTYEIAGSTMCTVGETPSSVPASFSTGGLDVFQFGTVQLQGVSLDRCRVALDPDFLEAYDARFGTIPPGAGGGSPDEPPSQPAAGADLCANNGGISWQGTSCVCPGVLDYVTLCADGAKIDQVTEQSCVPDDPAACQDQDAQQGGAPPVCACTCTQWNMTAYPPTCVSAVDCNGAACSP